MSQVHVAGANPPLTHRKRTQKQKQGAARGGASKKDIDMLVSSVEIVGADGQVQTVYFPVPE